MMRVMRRAAMLLWCLIHAACGGSERSSPTAPSAPPAAIELAYQSARFAFRHSAMDSATIVQTAAALEAEADRILEDIGVTTMPRVSVTLYPSVDALRQGVGTTAGPIPSFATGLVTGPTAIHLVSPNLATTWSYTDAVTSLVHEFAHCVSLVANPSFANNPRWLWESVALFEAGQYNDPRTLPYFTGTAPTFAQLNSFDNTIVYSVGATFGLFVVDIHGWDAYRQLIRSNGDLSRVLRTTEPAFLNDWRAFVRANFQIP
jgi:hypothetical protein